MKPEEEQLLEESSNKTEEDKNDLTKYIQSFNEYDKGKELSLDLQQATLTEILTKIGSLEERNALLENSISKIKQRKSYSDTVTWISTAFIIFFVVYYIYFVYKKIYSENK